MALSDSSSITIACLSFFDSIDRQRSRRGASLINCYCTCRKPPKSHGFTPSMSSSRSGSSLGNGDPLYLIPEGRPNRFEHEQWLQRRNSLSSQRAIYPHRYHLYDQRSKHASYSLPPSRYSSTLRSVSEGDCLELSNRYSSMTSSQSSNSWGTTRPSTLSSSRTRSTSNPEKGDLRRDPTAASAAQSAGIPAVPRIPTIPPPAWSPALTHVPLSADPTIRALSTGAGSRLSLTHTKLYPDLHVPPLKVKSSSGAAASSAKRGVSTPVSSTLPVSRKEEVPKVRSVSPRKPASQMPSVPPPPPPPIFPSVTPATLTIPAIPARAPGHLATSSTSGVRPQTSTSTATQSTSTTKTWQTTSSSRSSLRRPDPIRHRQHHHHPYSGLGLSQTQLPLQQYQHQRIWNRQNSRNPSVYSASSYGTHATDRTTSTVARGSTAYTPSLRPVTSGK